MKLKILARRDAQRVIGIVGDQSVARKILAGTEHATRELRPNHQDVLLDHLPFIPVVLLINPVKLEKFVIVLRKTLGGTVRQRLSNRARKDRIILLETLIAAELWRGILGNHKLISNDSNLFTLLSALCQPNKIECTD